MITLSTNTLSEFFKSSGLDKLWEIKAKHLSTKNSIFVINNIDISIRREFLDRLLQDSRKPDAEAPFHLGSNFTIRNQVVLFNITRTVDASEVVTGNNKKFTPSKSGTYHEFRFTGEASDIGNWYIHEKDINAFIDLNIGKIELAQQVLDNTFRNHDISILFDYTANVGPLRNVCDSYIKYGVISRSYSWYSDRNNHYYRDIVLAPERRQMFEEVSVLWGKINDAHRNHEIRGENMKELRWMMYGSEFSPVIDMVTKTPIAIIPEVFFNDTMETLIKSEESSFYLHHVKVMKGNSVHKSDVEPSNLLNKAGLTENKAIIIELLRCVILSDDTHKKIHRMAYSDGMLYLDKKNKPYALPWAISSEENFMQAIKRYPVLEGLVYDDVFNDIFFDIDEMIEIKELLKLDI
jgi:hypothetical protein